MKKGFLFDLDGVIAETAALHYQAWKDEVAKIGIDYTEEQNIALKGLPRMETLLGILKLHHVSNISSTQKQVMASRKNEAYIKMLHNQLSTENILPGIQKFLNQAQTRGIKMAITSSSHNAPLILQKLNLLHYFDYIVNPKEIANGKPAPDIYLAGAQGLNLKPIEVVGFEDAAAGVEGLKAGKIKTVAITWND